MPNRLVQPIHFEDFDGHQFERLVMAYLFKKYKWESLEWYGQTGGDSGVDIWGVRLRDGNTQGQKVCIQCANWRAIPFKKIKEDLEKVLDGPKEKPDEFWVITGGKVSAQTREKIHNLCKENQIHISQIISGQEFEELLRATDESLLKRFIEGEEFPDTPDDIQRFVQASSSQIHEVDKEVANDAVRFLRDPDIIHKMPNDEKRRVFLYIIKTDSNEDALELVFKQAESIFPNDYELISEVISKIHSWSDQTTEDALTFYLSNSNDNRIPDIVYDVAMDDSRDPGKSKPFRNVYFDILGRVGREDQIEKLRERKKHERNSVIKGYMNRTRDKLYERYPASRSAIFRE